MIFDFDKFRKLSTKYFVEEKRMKKLVDILQEMYDCTISNYRYFTFKIPEENFNTEKLRELEVKGGLTFTVGNGNHWKFILNENGCGEDKLGFFNELRELVGRHYTIGTQLKKMTGGNYTDTVINGKRYSLELTSQYWGFTIREYENKLPLDEIISIEKSTESEFVSRNSFGSSFRWKLHWIIIVAMMYKKKIKLEKIKYIKSWKS